MAKRTSHFLIQTSSGGDAEFSVAWSVTRWQPRVDVYETADALLIQVEAAGSDKKNRRLHYEAGQLIIEGQRDCRCWGEARCLQVEIDHGPIRRSLPLPSYADVANITARYEAGLLLITVPRLKPVAPQNVRVSIG